MPTYTTFKGQSSLADNSPNEIVGNNLKAWMDWAFLGIGAYTNVHIPGSGHYGGDWSRLRPVTDSNYSTGQVWEGPRKDWVWETGTGQNPEPIRVSGVEINGTFNFFSAHTPTAENTIEGYVDYPNGRIVLGSGIATNVAVRASYSYRWVHTYEVESDDILRVVQKLSHRPDKSTYLNSASGDWSSSAEMRVQLPAILLEDIGGSRKPYGLGGGHYLYSDFLCHVMAEDGRVAKRLSSILAEQQEKTIKAFNTNTVGRSGAFPLDLNGSVQSGALTYPNLVNAYPYPTITILATNRQGTNNVSKNVFQSPVRMRTETILAENY